MMEPKAIVDAIHAAKALWDTTWAFLPRWAVPTWGGPFLFDIAD